MENVLLSTLQKVEEALTAERIKYAMQYDAVLRKAEKYRAESDDPLKKCYTIFDDKSRRLESIGVRLCGELRDIDNALQDLHSHDFS